MITYWHNPRCSKSRAGLALLQDRGAAHEIRLYLKAPPDLDEIIALHAALGGTVFDMMRSGETIFKELGLTKNSPDSELFAAMVSYPVLIERPIAQQGAHAVIGRPTMALETLL